MDFSKLQATSKVTDEWKYPLAPANRSGLVQVDHEPDHKLYWEEYGNPDGEPVMFDETFVHTAENRSDVTRIILFCDVERPLRNRVMQWLNHVVEITLIRASQTENAPGDRVGAINRIFNVAYRVRLVGKWIKKKSRFAHYTLKWLILGGVLYLILR